MDHDDGLLTFLRICGSSTLGAVIKTLCIRVPSSNDFINHSVSRRNFESIEKKKNGTYLDCWTIH